MELKDIRYILAIAEDSSLTVAARKLYICQPTLSICVQRVEKELNAKLFNREKNKLVPTAAGQIFLEEGRRIIAKTNEMKQSIYDVINYDKGMIRVGFSSFYGRHYSPELFQLYQQRNPRVRIEVIEEFSKEVEEHIARGDLDLGIIPSPIFADNVAFEPLFEEKIHFAMSKKMGLPTQDTQDNTSDLPMIDLSAVKDQAFIMLKKHQKIRVISERICQEYGFTPRIMLETQDMNTINNFVALNLGVGFVSDIVERTSDKKDLVNYYRIDSDKASRMFFIAFKKDIHLSQACLSFIELAQEYFHTVHQ